MSASANPRVAPMDDSVWSINGANGQPAFAAHWWSDELAAYEAESILVLTLRGHQIEEITAFRTPEVIARFGLEQHLAA